MAKLEIVTYTRVECSYNIRGTEKECMLSALHSIHQLRDEAREQYEKNPAMRDTLNGLQHAADTLHNLLTDRPIQSVLPRY